jgi:hypothetical protein
MVHNTSKARSSCPAPAQHSAFQFTLIESLISVSLAISLAGDWAVSFNFTVAMSFLLDDELWPSE